MKYLIAFIILLCTISASGMEMIGFGGGGESLTAPTYYGTTVVPATGGSLYSSATTPTAVTPPATMVTGDLVVLYSYTSAIPNGDVAAISNTGGQTWNALDSYVRGTVGRAYAWWCRYDGTWDANPTISHTEAQSLTQAMQVFRPGDGSYTWALDITESHASYAAPGTPYDVTIPGVTTATDNAVVIAHWIAEGTTVTDWTLQTGGWANAGSDDYANYAGGDQTHSWAYLIKTPVGATGDVTNRQATGGPELGSYRILVFRQVAP